MKVACHEACNSEFNCPFVLVGLLPVKHLIFPGQNAAALIVELSILSRVIRWNYVYIFFTLIDFFNKIAVSMLE